MNQPNRFLGGFFAISTNEQKCVIIRSVKGDKSHENSDWKNNYRNYPRADTGFMCTSSGAR